ncbi:probable cyclic nucleotide-gated ion channel 20, chloroplastic [Daucus carota subsp. sativus]|uniref:probable cyclic nucleotide-gated ion channel 20, chloroplastic n=1 Tax=Daucus carota subsp. sativus TaxID=79200 RepID=UPI0007B28376
MHASKKYNALMQSATVISISDSYLNSIELKFRNRHSTNAKDSWARRSLYSLYECIPGVMNPQCKTVGILSSVFIFFFLLAFLIRTLLIFSHHAEKDRNCIVDSSHMGTALSTMIDLTKVSFILYIILMFRVAYVDPKSRVFVYDSKKVALNYLSGYFIVDLFLVVPLAQVIVRWVILRTTSFSYGPIEVVYFLQYMAVLCRLLSMLANQSTNALVFKSWLSKFVINLLAFFLFSHVVGSFWYYFALNRVAYCLRNACGENWCLMYVSCERRYENENFVKDSPSFKNWKNNNNATACFGPSGYKYGIYVEAVSLAQESNLPMRYIYSLFWGFQQISTLAGNQTPAFFVVEVLFTMFITATGLLLFSLLIGNIQSFLHALGRRSLEKSMRGLDVEHWMSHRRLPEKLKRQIRKSERYNWLATRGVNELLLLENLPEDLQRNIRRHLFKFVESIPIFDTMDESILDTIKERLKQKTYIKGRKLMVSGGLFDKLVFIVQGKLESIGEGSSSVVSFSEGDVCGEELVTVCLEHSIMKRNGEDFRIPAQKLLSKRTVRCLTDVEAFTLGAADLEEVFRFYSGLLIRNPHVKGVIRKQCPPHRQGLTRRKSF